MESHEVLKTSISEIGVKAVAAELGVSESLVYKWCQECPASELDEKSGARNPLDRILELYRLTRDRRLIIWLCERAGGYFVENSRKVPLEEVDRDVFRHTQTMVKSFSELLNEVSTAIDNGGVVDLTEAKRIRKEWEDLKREAEHFVSGCERGAFAGK
ncbi:MAG TPA: phage regulatory CII family protein [Planctomycetota bacterium]|nr:phage regulatory CII family protein [Planctomycetota bacterium]